ncbi:2-dehydro-3-deoxygalactonokinase [Tsuneonella sp. HG249]
MSWHQAYIAVDWGTTNRRAYRVERGGPTASFEDDFGLSSVPTGEFPAAVTEIRETLGDLPMLLAGMVGSKRGWHEAPYVEVPASEEALARRVLWIDHRTGILPGLCQRGDRGADVMRGEEVQIVGGIVAGFIPADSAVCHPGTHAKWVEVVSGRIVRFRTMMTGELFALLREHSILAEAVTGTAKIGPQFDAGVMESLSGRPPLSSLFQIRARGLLEGDVPDAVSRASGILIGSEVAAGLREFPGTTLTVLGRPDLCALYARALYLAGRDSQVVDGAEAFLAGIAKIVRRLP